MQFGTLLTRSFLMNPEARDLGSSEVKRNRIFLTFSGALQCHVGGPGDLKQTHYIIICMCNHRPPPAPKPSPGLPVIGSWGCEAAVPAGAGLQLQLATLGELLASSIASVTQCQLQMIN